MTDGNKVPLRNPEVTLLGPQRHTRTLGKTLRSLGIDGRVATITAGWQERERDDRELDAHLTGRSVNLGLHKRAERIWQKDRELNTAYRHRQEELRKLQELYRFRLGFAMDCARALLDRPTTDLVEVEREEAIDHVRQLDASHLQRIREVRTAYYQKWRPAERDAVQAERKELAEILDTVEATAIAGGHVAVLLNRLRLFDLGGLLAKKRIVAWSAGAMALTERVVLFHDSPPQGPGHAEVLEEGLGFVEGAVVLPHASRRLRLDDPKRVEVFARRFAPATCLTLDPGERIDSVHYRITSVSGASRLSDTGELGEAA